jgi:probable O-glycosylation ligase (exosortase A-associated)
MRAAPQGEWWRPALVEAGPWRPERVTSGEAAAGSGVPFLALMAFTFVLLLAPQTFIPALAPLRLGLLTAAVAITTHLLDRFYHRQPIMRMSPEMAVTAGLAAWAVLTIPLSYWPGGSLSFLTENYSKTLAIFWLLANVVTSGRRLVHAAWALSLMAAPLAAFGVREYQAGRFIGEGPVKRIQSFEAPLTQNPNDLALMLNLILPLTVALFLLVRRPGARLALSLVVALDVVAVVVTFSRTGFLTLATIFVMYVHKLLRRPGRGWVLAASILLLVGLPLLPASYVERLGTIGHIEADPSGSAQERWNDTLATLRLVSRNPLVGAGLGMNTLALNEARGPMWKEVHNVYLGIAADLGFPGLALLLTLMVLCLRATVSVQRRTAGDPDRRDLFLLAEGLQISLVAFSVAALFHPVAYDLYFYYFAGLALGARAAAGPTVPEGRA